jgi:membrane glycosyltransferase
MHSSLSDHKSSSMWVVVLTGWLLSIGSLQWSWVVTVFRHPPPLIHGTLLVYFICWLYFAWLYALHQMALVCCSAVVRRTGRSPAVCVGDRPAVAILYTTMNDFSQEAALSCTSQTYARCHVFLLDDSTDPTFQALVNNFHDAHRSSTTIIRRETRAGFKAGNLNSALDRIGAIYQYFAVCDADGVLPPNFVSELLGRFTDDLIGFVQAVQRPLRPTAPSRFSGDLGIEVSIYWKSIVPASERFGFVMFHGHGGIIRTDVWRNVGGFPAVVAEDLAFSTRARQYGYVGVIADDVVCYEEFPPSYEAFSRRHAKYARGACEHLQHEMWPFLCSRNVRWFEKADRFLATLSMVSAFPVLLFILDYVLLLSGVFGPAFGTGPFHGPTLLLSTNNHTNPTLLALGPASYVYDVRHSPDAPCSRCVSTLEAAASSSWLFGGLCGNPPISSCVRGLAIGVNLILREQVVPRDR